MNRTRDDYQESDLLLSNIRKLTINAADKDRNAVAQILGSFGANNIMGLTLRDLRPYVEALYILLEDAPPTAAEWKELEQQAPYVYAATLDMLRKIRWRPAATPQRWETFP